MRLDFNVLWVDDQLARVEAQKVPIARQMAEHGFDFRPTFCTSIEQVRGYVADDVYHDEVDMVLVDWDLGRTAEGVLVEGQSAIAAVRSRIPYKDVIFYSSNKPAGELRQLVFESGAEGVYCVARDELVNEVVGVFESLIKKVIDLDHARGIVMGATSDIDEMVIACLTSMHHKHAPEEQAKMIAIALARIPERLQELKELEEKLKKANKFGKILRSHMVFGSNDRLRMLIGALEHDLFKVHQDYTKIAHTYMEEVIPHRNSMGHKSLVPASKESDDADDSGQVQVMSLKETQQMRVRLLELRSKFRDLLNALRSSP